MIKRRIRAAREATIKIGSLREISYSYYSINELDLIKNSCGWYCWVYIPENPENKGMGIYRIYELETISSTNFGMAFNGSLKNIEPKNKVSLKTDQLYNMQATLLAFSPPLYIGISTILNQRLKTHKRQLEEFIQNSQLEEDIKSRIIPDSDEESRFFGHRIGKKIVELDIKLTELYVKVVYTKSKENLKNIELILNKMLYPPYGRR